MSGVRTDWNRSRPICTAVRVSLMHSRLFSRQNVAMKRDVVAVVLNSVRILAPVCLQYSSRSARLFAGKSASVSLTQCIRSAIKFDISLCTSDTSEVALGVRHL